MRWGSNWFQSEFLVEKCLRDSNLASFFSLGDSKGVKKGLLSKISNFAVILGNFGESMKQVEFQTFSRWILYTKGQSTMGPNKITVYASDLRERGRKLRFSQNRVVLLSFADLVGMVVDGNKDWMFLKQHSVI